jgi:hypothetical protein
MKAFPVFSNFIWMGLLLSYTSIQAQNVQNNIPDTKYNVHRQYDEKGNLIEYDSSSASTWSSDTGNVNLNSVIEEWNMDALNEGNDTNSLIPVKPDFFGFDGEDDEFFFPSFPDIEDLLRKMDKSFDKSRNDSAARPLNPGMPDFYFDQRGFPLDNDIADRIREMEKRINEMMNRQMELFNKPLNSHNNHIQDPIESDSIKAPDPNSSPKTVDYDKRINI